MSAAGDRADACTTCGKLAGLVSVITPAYNASAVIERAIRSVAGQTVPVLEHIIVDDGSTDRTGEIVQELQPGFPHIIYSRQLRQGAAVALNSGIAQARGRYIAFLDSDDYWSERKVERQIGFMEETGAPFTYGDYRKVGPVSGKPIRELHPPDRLTHDDILKGCPIGCLTAAYNQERLGKVYMPPAARGQDWGLWLALTRRGIDALRYPGMEASYASGAGSLSGNKLFKAVDMYRIYRTEEHIGRTRTFWFLARQVWSKLEKELFPGWMRQ